jgi:hypothetical protein
VSDLLEVKCGNCGRKFYLSRRTLIRSDWQCNCPNPDCGADISVGMENPDDAENGLVVDEDEDDGEDEEFEDEVDLEPVRRRR